MQNTQGPVPDRRPESAEGAEARPTVVLVHGTRMSRAQWDRYPALLPGVDVLSVDLPGHGDRAGEEFTEEAALRTIDDAVARAGVATAPVLVGHSLGGYLAMMWAAEHPRALAALVLVGASAVPAGPLTGLYRGFARLLPVVGPDRMARVVNRLLRALGAERGPGAAPLPDGAGYAALPAAWALVMRRARPELLTGVEAPVVLVNGQLDQMRVHVRRFARACQDPRLVLVPRASHLLPLTHPEQVARVVREVLDGHRSGPAVAPTLEE